MNKGGRLKEDPKLNIRLEFGKEDLKDGYLTRERFTELVKESYKDLNCSVESVDFHTVGTYITIRNEDGFYELIYDRIIIPEDGLHVE